MWKVAMYLVRRCCDRTLQETASLFGVGSYGVVGCACHGIETELRVNRKLRDQIHRIEQTIYQQRIRPLFHSHVVKEVKARARNCQKDSKSTAQGALTEHGRPRLDCRTRGQAINCRFESGQWRRLSVIHVASLKKTPAI